MGNYVPVQNVVALVHTHGSFLADQGEEHQFFEEALGLSFNSSDFFSWQDIEFAFRNGYSHPSFGNGVRDVNVYVATPAGMLLEFSPHTGLVSLIATDIPRDRNHPDDRDTSIKQVSAVIKAFNTVSAQQ